VAGADKRQRKKDNARAAREAREAALRRQRQRKTAIRVGVLVALFAIVVGLFAALGGNNDKPSATATSSSTTVAPTTPTTVAAPTETTVAKVPASATATIKTNFGPIVVELDTKNAPNGSARFIKLAKQGFYDGLDWVRASKDFVIQGGSPTNTQAGGEGHPIIGEVPKDHYPLGSIAAAKTGADAPGTFDSQFFVVTGSEGATLPNDYARFGKVVMGIENAQKIEALAPQSGDGAPTKQAIIEKVTITEG
jgi:peptidyl-prolyl cis-trans isomerase B (cyclophilin B)